MLTDVIEKCPTPYVFRLRFSHNLTPAGGLTRSFSVRVLAESRETAQSQILETIRDARSNEWTLTGIHEQGSDGNSDIWLPQILELDDIRECIVSEAI